MKIVVFILFSVVMLSCSNDAWTSYEKKEFIKGCKDEGGGTYYCDCFMKEMMSAYPDYDESHNISLEEAVELAAKCE